VGTLKGEHEIERDLDILGRALFGPKRRPSQEKVCQLTDRYETQGSNPFLLLPWALLPI
jgi:hypothetical protein